MPSKFYILHPKFEEVIASKWRNAAYTAIAPDGGYDDSVIANWEKVFYNHYANPITKEKLIYCI